MRTTDCGLSWSAFDTGSSHSLKDIFFVDADTGFVVGRKAANINEVGKGIILRTSDAGENWQLQDSVTLNGLFAIHFADNRNGAAVGNNGVVLISHDAGLTWKKEFSRAAGALHDVYFTDADTGFVVGGSGAIVRRNSTEPVSVRNAAGQGDNPRIVQEFYLEQNYPNPFNAATSISFSLTQTGQVTMGIYDVQGRLVQNLVNEKLHAGTYRHLWQTYDVASGIYFIHFLFQPTDNNLRLSESRKIVLIR